MKAQYVYEKFEDKSDPIKDMGIGIEELFKNLKAGDILRVKQKLDFRGSGGKKWPINSLVVIRRIVESFGNSVERQVRFRYDYYLNKRAYENDNPQIADHDWTITYPFFLKHFDIVNSKELKEDVNEKFSDISDPIKDMGIGATTWENLKPGDVLRIKKPINNVDHKVGNYILINSIEELPRENRERRISIKYKEYRNKKSLLVKSTEAYGNKWEMSIPWAKEHFKIVQKWELKESLTEKFSEDSDSIHDMGIGIDMLVKNTIKNIYELDKKYGETKGWFLWDNSLRNYVHAGTMIRELEISRRHYERGIRVYLYFNLYSDKYKNKSHKNIDKVEYCKNLLEEAGISHLFDRIEKEPYRKEGEYKYVCWGVRFFVKKQYNKYFIPYLATVRNTNESVNEKFTEKSDPVHDMGIGIEELPLT